MRLLAVLAIALLAACSSPEPAPTGGPGGPFQLVDQNGRATDEALLKGRWSAVFFGFTQCPEICPVTLQALAAAEAELPRRMADKLQVVFITVDPARDTPAALKAYLADDSMPQGVVGLTGTPAQVEAATKAFKVYAGKVGEGADYTMDHSTQVLLMNPDGVFVRVLAYGMTPAEMAVQIRDAMRG